MSVGVGKIIDGNQFRNEYYCLNVIGVLANRRKTSHRCCPDPNICENERGVKPC